VTDTFWQLGLLDAGESYADDTRSRNRRQKLAPETGVGFWRQFLERVSGVLVIAISNMSRLLRPYLTE